MQHSAAKRSTLSGSELFSIELDELPGQGVCTVYAWSPHRTYAIAALQKTLWLCMAGAEIFMLCNLLYASWWLASASAILSCWLCDHGGCAAAAFERLVHL